MTPTRTVDDQRALPMTQRLRVALLFGGRSAEHDVSLLSAGNVFRALDPAKYEVVPIAITRDGVWLLCAQDDGAFPAAVPASGPRVALLPGGGGRYLVMPAADGGAAPRTSDDATPRTGAVDVMFPVLHGPFGEDGTVQGAAELAGVAYVGSDVLGSAVAMDKDVAKRLLRDAGLPMTRFLVFAAPDTPSFDAVVEQLGRPVFVKPARLGRRWASARPGPRKNSTPPCRSVSPRPEDLGGGLRRRPRGRMRRAGEPGRFVVRVGAGRDRADQPAQFLYLRSQIPR